MTDPSRLHTESRAVLTVGPEDLNPTGVPGRRLVLDGSSLGAASTIVIDDGDPLPDEVVLVVDGTVSRRWEHIGNSEYQIADHRDHGRYVTPHHPTTPAA